MPHEHRVIVFSADEVSLALAGYRRARPSILPPGRITGCVPVDKGARVRIEVGQVGGSETREHEIDSDALREALVRFCLEINVKLPQLITKRVLNLKGRYVLEMDFDSCDASSNETGQKKRSVA